MLWLASQLPVEAILLIKVSVLFVRDLWYLWAMCVRASMKAAKPLHIVLATNPNPTRARGYPLNINPKPDPKPDSISGPAGSGRVADL